MTSHTTKSLRIHSQITQALPYHWEVQVVVTINQNIADKVKLLSQVTNEVHQVQKLQIFCLSIQKWLVCNSKDLTERLAERYENSASQGNWFLVAFHFCLWVLSESREQTDFRRSPSVLLKVFSQAAAYSPWCQREMVDQNHSALSLQP